MADKKPPKKPMPQKDGLGKYAKDVAKRFGCK